MKIYITKGEHWFVPGTPTTLHWTREAAEAAALDLVKTLVADLDPEHEAPHFAEPADSGWKAMLRAAQIARLTFLEGDISDETAAAIRGEHVFGYEDADDYLAQISEGAVWIEEHEIAPPVVNRDGPYRPELAEAFRQGARELQLDCLDIPADALVEEGEDGEDGAYVHCRVYVSDRQRLPMPGEEEEASR